MASGRLWVYSAVRHPPALDNCMMSERRDPSFPSTGPLEPWSVDSRRESWPEITPVLPVMECPSFVPRAQGGNPDDMYEFNLLDAERESLRIFAEILNDLRYHNGDIWV
ncbi:hypothetical protein DFH29DRAFT_1004321 [Suillus ampliporus]|nr:hypothetical protein DFH29DRAFT_1004321 [Suillus ampliporus]